MNFGTTDSMADMLETEYDDEDLYDDTEDNNSNDLEEAIENARLKAAAAAAAAVDEDDDDDSSTHELVIAEDMQTDSVEAKPTAASSSSVSPSGQALFAKKKRGRPSGGRNSFSSTSSSASSSNKVNDLSNTTLESGVVKRSTTPTCVLAAPSSLTSTALTANIPPPSRITGFNYNPSSTSGPAAKCK